MLIYKICHQAEWAQAERQALYAGSAKDREDRFIHFSTAEQVPGTLARYPAPAPPLGGVGVAPPPGGEARRAQRARAGALFPHLYGTLPLTFVRWAKPLARKADGRFELPKDCI